ncbi:NAD(P)-dependent oxidoreductase [uncultured Thomasclavelia sp.]|uniref:NAD(P)-dependent oxidoreductase n=1 Tax=uncultured Thomasclavelia sp. TaxID=3025759 RepID=UPI0025E8FD36|nr:NAD(P)-dependent oxidoreductase [uncultured Thomasclavelia sp.]
MIVYIYGNDSRVQCLKTIFKNDGYQIIDDIQQVSNCDIVYLGKDGQGFEGCDFKRGAIVLTLLKNQRLNYLSNLKEFTYDYLYRDEKFVCQNTLICDEALIAYMIIDNNISLANSKILILGYGHCGKDLAGKLSSFDAKITIANRDNHHYDEVIKEGYSYQSLKHLNLKGYDFIINTIPYPVLTRKILTTKNPSCQIYDLASKPYGVKKIDRDTNYHLLTKLPTKYAYLSSGKILYDVIKRMVNSYAGK